MGDAHAPARDELVSAVSLRWLAIPVALVAILGVIAFIIVGRPAGIGIVLGFAIPIGTFFIMPLGPFRPEIAAAGHAAMMTVAVVLTIIAAATDIKPTATALAAASSAALGAVALATHLAREMRFAKRERAIGVVALTVGMLSVPGVAVVGQVWRAV